MSISIWPKRGSIAEIISRRGKTPDGLIDMRGFDWSAMNNQYLIYREGRISGVDFSNSRSEKYFSVRRATFSDCVFDNSKWTRACLSSEFVNCSFNGCSMYSSGMYGSSFGNKFCDCTFNNLFSDDSSFSFGYGTLYKNCSFESINIDGLYDQIGTRFEDCVINGVLKAAKGGPVYFHGRQFASEVRHDGILHLLFCPEYSPVRFIRCDLTGLKTKGIVFEKDVIFEDCKGMPSELKDFGPVVYV